MAQVSIQYTLHEPIGSHDKKAIKKLLDMHQGVSSVSVNTDNGIVCVDFDDTGVSEQVLEDVLKAHGYCHTLLDKIIF